MTRHNSRNPHQKESHRNRHQKEGSMLVWPRNCLSCGFRLSHPGVLKPWKVDLPAVSLVHFQSTRVSMVFPQPLEQPPQLGQYLAFVGLRQALRQLRHSTVGHAACCTGSRGTQQRHGWNRQPFRIQVDPSLAAKWRQRL